MVIMKTVAVFVELSVVSEVFADNHFTFKKRLLNSEIIFNILQN